MAEYVQLKHELYSTIAVIGIVICGAVWLAFGLNVALNYLLGAVVGLVYIRMLAQEVEKLGNNKRTLNSNRLGLFAGVMILAMLVPKLQVLPVFFGFLTYKVALLVYTCRLLLIPSDRL